MSLNFLEWSTILIVLWNLGQRCKLHSPSIHIFNFFEPFHIVNVNHSNLFEFHYVVTDRWCWVINENIEMCRLQSESYSEVVKISDDKEFKNSWISPEKINSFVPNAPFLYPLRTSKNRKFFWSFQRVEKRCIGNKWIKETEIIVSLQNVLQFKLRMDKSSSTFKVSQDERNYHLQVYVVRV